MPKGRIVLDAERCKGCSLCTIVCPQGVLGLSSRLNAHGYIPVEAADMGSCTGCGMCAVVCPDVCFTVYRQTAVHRSVDS